LKNEIVAEMPPGVSVAQVLNFLVLGFEDICKSTLAFQETITDLTVVDKKDYTLVLSTQNAVVTSLIDAYISTLPSPIVVLATATTGGTLAAATYYYRVSATNDRGETLGSLETSIATTGSTSTVTLSWAAISKATGYKVYGRTTGAEQLLATYSSGAWDSDPVGTGTITLWVDDGSLSPSGALPEGDVLVRTLDTISGDMVNAVDGRWTQGITTSVNLSGIKAVIYNGTDSVRLSRIPKNEGIGLRFIVALIPTRSFSYTATLPLIFEQYLEGLKFFAMSKLYLLPPSKVSWRDPAMAQIYWDGYKKARGDLKIKILVGYGERRIMPGLFGGQL
jgi:hypothetical protein